MNLNGFLREAIANRSVRQCLSAEKRELKGDTARSAWLEHTRRETRASLARVGEPIENVVSKRYRVRFGDSAALYACKSRKMFNHLGPAYCPADAHAIDQ